MTTAEIKSAVLERTRVIVSDEKFARIARLCPYFETWWTVELAQSLDQPESPLRVAGFEPRCVSEVRTNWYPDLILYGGSPRCPEDLVWMELKQLNLLRNGAVGELSEPLVKKLRVQLKKRWSDFQSSFNYARSLHVEKTCVSFADRSVPLQNFTLITALRGPNALASLQRARHWAAAFMLAVVPQDWQASFKAEARKMTGDMQALRQVDFFEEELCTFDSGAIRIILVGAITNVAVCTDR